MAVRTILESSQQPHPVDLLSYKPHTHSSLAQILNTSIIPTSLQFNLAAYLKDCQTPNLCNAAGILSLFPFPLKVLITIGERREKQPQFTELLIMTLKKAE